MDVHVVYQQVSLSCPPADPANRVNIGRVADSRQAFVTIGTEVVPNPWQLWPDNLKKMYKVSSYLLTVTFWCLHIAHAEEVQHLPEAQVD